MYKDNTIHIKFPKNMVYNGMLPFEEKYSSLEYERVLVEKLNYVSSSYFVAVY